MVLDRSRQGRTAEIVGWSNAAAAAGLAVAVAVFTGVPWTGAFAFVLAFVLLRLMLTHPRTVAIAAWLGTLAVAAAAGTLAWLFGHVVDRAGFAEGAAVVAALVGGAVPAWAYADLASQRQHKVPDSLLTGPAPSSSDH